MPGWGSRETPGAEAGAVTPFVQGARSGRACRPPALGGGCSFPGGISSPQPFSPLSLALPVSPSDEWAWPRHGSHPAPFLPSLSPST